MRYKFIESINWTNNWIFVWPDLTCPFQQPLLPLVLYPMSHSFHTELSRIWQISVDLYRRGNNSAEDFPIANEVPILSGWGLNKMDVFDYVEDWCLHEEPDLITFVLVHYERWNFFVHEQKSELSSKRLDPSSLPQKTEDAAGIIWLPRILPKARAKLRGELPPSVMYGCGGDRHFFRSNNIHPAEFLRVVRQWRDNDQAIIQWVLDRQNSSLH